MLQQSHVYIFLSFKPLLLEYFDISIYYLCNIHFWGFWGCSVSSMLFALYFLLSHFLSTAYILSSLRTSSYFTVKFLTSKFLLSFGRGKEQTQLIAYKKKNLSFLIFWRFYQFTNICGIIFPWRIFIEFFKLLPAAKSKMPVWHFVMPNCWAWQNFVWASRLLCIQPDLTDIWS